VKLIRALGGFVQQKAHYWGVPAILAVWAAWWLNDAKGGIRFNDIALEFAGSFDRAEAVVGNNAAMVRATLVRDFVFLVLVFLGLAMLVAWVRKQYRPGFWNEAGGVLMWAALGGGVLDVIEDVALLGYLGNWLRLEQHWPAIAAAAAGLKWAIVVFVVVYGVIGLALALFRATNRIPEIHPVERLTDWPKGDPTHRLVDIRTAMKEKSEAASDEDPSFEDTETTGERADDRRSQITGALQQQPGDLSMDDALLLGELASDWGIPDEEEQKTAICCSGGGVRSATYSLGALQVLAEKEYYQKADYLIAVSGGSYIASAHAMLDAGRPEDERLERPVFAPGSAEANHNRNNSNYLAPTLPSKYVAIGRALVGLLMTLAFVASLLVLVGRPWGALVASEGLYPEIAFEVDGLASAANDIEAAAGEIVELVADEPDDPDGELILVDSMPLGTATLYDDVAEAVASLEERFTEVVEESDGELPGDLVDDTEAILDDAGDLSRFGGASVDRLYELAAHVRDNAATYAAEANRIATPHIPFPGGWWPIAAALLGAAVCGVVAIAVRKIASNPVRQSNWARGSGLFLTAAAFLLLTFVVFPYLFTRGPSWLVDQGKAAFAFIQTLGSGAILAAAAGVLIARRSSLPASIVGGLVAPLLALLAIINIAGGGARAGSLFEWGWVDLAIVVGALVVYLLVASRADLITWSLHPYYRRRLSVAYGLRRTPDGGVETVYPNTVPLSDLADTKPVLIVCAAANIGDVGFAPAGREANSFTFGPKAIHIPNLGVVRTKLLESLGSAWSDEVSIQGAVAISGAAASPAMGKHTLPTVRALLALANVRLGVWLPNPLFVQEVLRHELDAAEISDPTSEQLAEMTEKLAPYFERVPASYLLKEILGLHRARDRYMYVTDGGHWENLGLVEALRRRCTLIFVLDASGDEPDVYRTLGEAMAIARMETSVEVELGLAAPDISAPDTIWAEDDEETEDEPLISPIDHIVKEFYYVDEDGEKTRGTIVYCKAAVTENAPLDVITYQRAHPAFPSDPTLADQFFDHEQYEAYRALGAHTMRQALDTLET